ncbi:hypothetical protein Pcinc_003452 [Petrolisthes cinctipes]|uniref:Uncharacterized protein n=1 Tax=Petrolisthes cinctipes TaxID=88211 RepID=A0AAE1L192_PETCI|nr:hypothetical protein Pcinc_003452 [Petrolisthes cinctipes]
MAVVMAAVTETVITLAISGSKVSITSFAVFVMSLLLLIDIAFSSSSTFSFTNSSISVETGFGGPVRTLKQLQKIWDYLKQMAKKEHTIYNRELRKTGGGDPPPPESEDTKFIMDFIKDEFKVPESEFDCDNVKPAIIQQDQQESQDTPLCTIFVGEDDFINADLLDATGLPNQQGPHSRAANNSAVLATFEEPTVRYNQERHTPNGAGAFGNISGTGGISRASTSKGTGSILSPLENINRDFIPVRGSTSKAVHRDFSPLGSHKRPEKRRKRQLKFANENMQENYVPSGSHVRENTNIILSDLLIQETRKRVEHIKNLCQADEERRTSFREKEELEKNILEEKLASFREKEELEKNCLKLKMQMMRRQMDRFEI